MKLNKTHEDVYYIYDYIPEYKWDNYKSEDTEISQRLLRYKREDKKYAWNFFTNTLKKAIIEFSNNELDDNVNEIMLVAVPPSKVNKYSPIRLSISKIVDNDEIKSSLNNVNINDGGELLIRSKDVPTSHKERRAEYFEHVLSIDFNENLAENFTEDAVYIILDDITTTGLIMNVCRDTLIDYNIDQNKCFNKNIYNYFNSYDE